VLVAWGRPSCGNDYAESITWRRALAESRNVSAVKVASWAGLDRVAALWEQASGQRLQDRPPSLTLGAIGGTPVEVARAYTVFANGGVAPALKTVGAAIENGRGIAEKRAPRC